MSAKIFWIFIIKRNPAEQFKLQFQKWNKVQHNKLYIPTFFHFIRERVKRSRLAFGIGRLKAELFYLFLSYLIIICARKCTTQYILSAELFDDRF